MGRRSRTGPARERPCTRSGSGVTSRGTPVMRSAPPQADQKSAMLGQPYDQATRVWLRRRRTGRTGPSGGGVFVIDCFVPDLARFNRGQRVQTLAVTEDSATLELSRHDAAQQRVTTQIVTLDGQGTHLRPVAIRYCWPSELDLMAEQAGLRMQERHSDWHRRPFGSTSGGHVSVYQRA